jgi:hypothetical protein
MKKKEKKRVLNEKPKIKLKRTIEREHTEKPEEEELESEELNDFLSRDNIENRFNK